MSMFDPPSPPHPVRPAASETTLRGPTHVTEPPSAHPNLPVMLGPTSQEALERLTVERITTLRGRFGESQTQKAERPGGGTADLSLDLM